MVTEPQRMSFRRGRGRKGRAEGYWYRYKKLFSFVVK